jgi:hypothetical protein
MIMIMSTQSVILTINPTGEEAITLATAGVVVAGVVVIGVVVIGVAVIGVAVIGAVVIGVVVTVVGETLKSFLVVILSTVGDLRKE